MTQAFCKITLKTTKEFLEANNLIAVPKDLTLDKFSEYFDNSTIKFESIAKFAALFGHKINNAAVVSRQNQMCIDVDLLTDKDTLRWMVIVLLIALLIFINYFGRRA